MSETLNWILQEKFKFSQILNVEHKNFHLLFIIFGHQTWEGGKLWPYLEHFFFRQYKTIQINSRIYRIFFVDFKNFTKIKTFCRQIFVICNGPGHMRSQNNFGRNRFCRFDDYWIQTNKHPPRQAKCIYLYI